MIARIVLQHHGGLIWKGVQRDEVAPPNLDAIDAEIARRHIDQPLQHEGGFRTAGAAIGVGWHGVRKHHLRLAIDRRGGIDAGEQRAIKVGRNVGAECRALSNPQLDFSWPRFSPGLACRAGPA